MFIIVNLNLKRMMMYKELIFQIKEVVEIDVITEPDKGFNLQLPRL